MDQIISMEELEEIESPVGRVGEKGDAGLDGTSFDVHSNPTLDPHGIGWAVKCLKLGFKVARKGWNGKGMFLWMLPAQELKMEWLHDDVKKKLAEENGGTLFANATVCLYNAQHQVTTGWTPWIEDLLAEDWVVVETDTKVEIPFQV